MRMVEKNNCDACAMSVNEGWWWWRGFQVCDEAPESIPWLIADSAITCPAEFYSRLAPRMANIKGASHAPSDSEGLKSRSESAPGRKGCRQVVQIRRKRTRLNVTYIHSWSSRLLEKSRALCLHTIRLGEARWLKSIWWRSDLVQLIY